MSIRIAASQTAQKIVSSQNRVCAITSNPIE